MNALDHRPKPEDYVPFVTSLARRVMIRHRIPAWLTTHEDLAQEGCHAMLCIAHRYDPERCATFTTFVYPRVHGAMLDHLRRCFRQTLGKPPEDIGGQLVDERHARSRRVSIIALRSGLELLTPRQTSLVVSWACGHSDAELARSERKHRSAITRERHAAFDALRCSSDCGRAL